MRTPDRPSPPRRRALLRLRAPALALLLSPLAWACDDETSAGQTAADAATDAGPRPDLGLDDFDPTCADPAWTPGTCVAGVGQREANAGNRHFPETEPIVYADEPPSSGHHRGVWARWGRYSALPAQRWLHNLEHGGVAFLHHPCLPAAEVAALQAVIEDLKTEIPDFRYVLTPYPDLRSAVAVVAWEWRYLAECVRADEVTEFARRVHRQAPEDIARDGGYDRGFIAR